MSSDGEEKKEETPSTSTELSPNPDPNATAVPDPNAPPPKIIAPTLKVDLDSKVEDSVAFTLLEDLTKRIGADEVEQFKAVYQRLWEAISEAFSQEKDLLKKSRQLNNEVLGERVGMEKARIRQQNEQDNIEHLERERDATQKLLDEAEHSDTVVKYEVS